MTRSITITVPKPCQEQWSSFTPTEAGGFCQKCCKEVLDFTNMSDAQLLSSLKEKPGRVCGRFRAAQLKTYVNPIAQPVPTFTLAKAGFLGLIVMFSGSAVGAPLNLFSDTEQHTIPAGSVNTVYHGEFSIKGKVLDETGLPLPGVNVLLRGTTYGTVTDVNGEFNFPQRLKEGDVLLFSFIGYMTQEYKVGKSQDDTISIDLKMDYLVTLGELTIDEVYTKRPGLIARIRNKIKQVFT